MLSSSLLGAKLAAAPASTPSPSPISSAFAEEVSRLYLDYNAGIPTEPQHLQKLCQHVGAGLANPSSQHFAGRKAKLLLEGARSSIARSLGVLAEEIFFCSGATEANNLLLQGLLKAYWERATTEKALPSIVYTAMEHPSLLLALKSLEQRGLCVLHCLPVCKTGVLSVEVLKAALTQDTFLVVLAAMNHEIGQRQDLLWEALPELRRAFPRLLWLSDCVQAYGKIPLSALFVRGGLDYASFSGHKIGALAGIGCFYIRAGHASTLTPLIWGGPQEKRQRAGTENLLGAVSMGLRAEELYQRGGTLWTPESQEAYVWLRDALQAIPGLVLHGAAGAFGNTLNFHVEGVPLAKLLLRFEADGVAVSTGSACSSGLVQPSSVLLAMGYSEDVAKNSIRLSLGPATCRKELARIVRILESL